MLKEENKLHIAYAFLVAGLILFALFAYAKHQEVKAMIANPSASFCEEQGGKYKIITATSGNQDGTCTIGSVEHDAWDYFYHNYMPKE